MDENKILDFFILVGKLKDEKRRGWKVSGVKNAESVADHSYRLALMTFIIGSKMDLDVNRAVKMALVHDIAESIIGDIIVWKDFDMTKKDKRVKELEAMERIREMLGDHSQEVIELWEEYEENATVEAKFVKEMDVFEMLVQAMEYKTDANEDELNDYIETFFEKSGSAGTIKNPELIKMLEIIKKKVQQG